MIEYNKLVRDRIPYLIEQRGAKPDIVTVEGPEFLELLFSKLGEECNELRSDQNAEEMADVLEVLMACSSALGIPWADIEAVRHEKLRAKGGFDKGVVLRSVQEI